MRVPVRICRPLVSHASLVAMVVFCCLPRTAPAQPPLVRAQMPDAKTRNKIADVIVTGNHTVATQQVVALLKSRPGTEYSSETVQEDVRTLFATKQFADVRVNLENLPDGRVTLKFYVREFPSVIEKIVYLGAKHLSDEELNTATGLRPDKPLDPVENKRACLLITQKYNEQGRPFASCVLLSGGNPTDKQVVFQITEGPKVTVSSIEMTGNTFVGADVLRQHIKSGSHFGGLIFSDFNPLMADADAGELVKYYNNFGFHDARVSREVQWAPDGRTVKLIFHIVEGPRYRIKDIPQPINCKALSPEEVQRLSKVKAGDFYLETTIQDDVTRIKNYYGDEGRLTKVTPIPIFDDKTPGLVTVQYEIEEKPPAKVGQILIVGNTRTKQTVILDELTIFPGQVLSYPEIKASERALARRGIFKSSPDGSEHPTITVLDEDSDNPFKTVMVNVQEDNTGSFIIGAGVTSDAGLTGSIVLNERNFDWLNPPMSIDDVLNGRAWRGAGQELRLEAVPGTQLQRYSATFREPRLFDSLFSLTLGAYYYDRSFDEYNENRFGGSIAIGRQLNKYWKAEVRTRVEEVGVYDIAGFLDGPPPPDYTSVAGANFLVGVRPTITRDTRDSYLRPTSGDVMELSYEQVYSNGNFGIFNANFNKYFTIFQRNDGSGKHVLALHSQFAWAGDNTPVYERFFAGGFQSIRGFQFRGVGPDINGYQVGGDFMFLNSAEYQVPLTAKDQVYAVAFVDSGTVETNIKDWTTYRVAAGFGFRFVVPLMGPVPIALDFGFPLVKAASDRNQMFSFYLGFYKF
jgi:outer membrane protein insertion porin family